MKSEDSLSHSISEFDFSKSSICIVKSVYHSDITDSIYYTCIELLKEQKIENVYSIDVSGSYELIYGCSKAIDIIKNVDGIIAIGCVIKGDTEHDVYINNAICNQLGALTIAHNIPIGLGVLTVNNHQQAIDRTNGVKANKGKEVTEAVLNAIGFRLNKI